MGLKKGKYYFFTMLVVVASVRLCCLRDLLVLVLKIPGVVALKPLPE